MATAVVIRWQTPPPSSIDERLIVDEDGTARLEVLRPRVGPDTIGVFDGRVDEAELAALSALGPTVLLDLVVPDPQLADLAFVADQVADRLRESPRAVAQFLARPLGGAPGGAATVALVVLARGSAPVEFELDVEESAVQFSSAHSPVSWAPLPALPMGFMTADAEGLGGVRQRATVRPGVLGAISMEVLRPEGADAVSAHLVGRWYLAAGAEAEEFEVRTEPAAW